MVLRCGRPQFDRRSGRFDGNNYRRRVPPIYRLLFRVGSTVHRESCVLSYRHPTKRLTFVEAGSVSDIVIFYLISIGSEPSVHNTMTITRNERRLSTSAVRSSRSRTPDVSVEVRAVEAWIYLAVLEVEFPLDVGEVGVGRAENLVATPEVRVAEQDVRARSDGVL